MSSDVDEKNQGYMNSEKYTFASNFLWRCANMTLNIYLRFVSYTFLIYCTFKKMKIKSPKSMPITTTS